MKYTVEPWNVTGISKNGPYIKVRGTIPGENWAMANVPFTATETQFYAVKEAEKIAKLISFAPTMYRLVERLAQSSYMEGEAALIVNEIEEFNKNNK